MNDAVAAFVDVLNSATRMMVDNAVAAAIVDVFYPTAGMMVDDAIRSVVIDMALAAVVNVGVTATVMNHAGRIDVAHDIVCVVVNHAVRIVNQDAFGTNDRRRILDSDRCAWLLGGNHNILLNWGGGDDRRRRPFGGADCE